MKRKALIVTAFVLLLARLAVDWKAFGKYLRKMSKDGQLAAERLDVWDSYFPYAVIFGIANPWIAQFSRLDAPAPVWFYAYPHTSGSSLDVHTPATLASLQDAFNGMVSTLQGSSSGGGGSGGGGGAV
ncbi:MAG: DUF2207 domain-containing protein [Chloroflexi bacterium]|nr:DUF2207 domain-containing protein [Chloroflexota bacterium]